MSKVSIECKENGSLRVLVNDEIIVKLCRWDHTKNPPYCDSTHKNIDFKAPESEIKILE